MKNVTSVIAIMGTMVTTAVIAGAVIFQPATAATTIPAKSPTAQAPAAYPSPSVEFCQKVFNDALENHTQIFPQLFDNEDEAKLIGDTRNIQTVICSVYFKGMMDGIALSDPKA